MRDLGRRDFTSFIRAVAPEVAERRDAAFASGEELMLLIFYRPPS